jgi:cyclophilin family peptidyl-prolyl cis-trans isomerase
MALRRGLPLALLVVALAGCGGGGSKQPQAVKRDAAGCALVGKPKPEQRTAPKPTAALDPAKTYDVVLQTNCGSVTIRLAVKTSPAATASFVSLARRGFFDHTIFDRIVPGFVIQGGDPTASQTGGPGYETLDRPPASTRYTLGVVAMAKAPSEPAGTAGSQFFVVTAKDAQLPPDYALLGTVTKGLGVVNRVGKLGDPATEQPTEVVEIEKATVHVG